MTTSRPTAESRIIRLLSTGQSSARADVTLGIGDDAAITTLGAGLSLLTATDALVEGTHFLPDESAVSLGHRILAVNLSDIAAMGGQPRWASLTLSLPDYDDAWLTDFARGFFELAQRYDVALIGGDTVRGPLALTLTLQASVPDGAAVRRDGARPGDLVYVTGAPGEAAAGRLLRAQGLAEQPNAAESDRLIKRFCYPEPRVQAGLQLRDIATAMIDISDGVHADVGRLLQASQCGADLVVPGPDDFPALQAAAGEAQARDFFLHGGEDYELCFTVPAAAAATVRDVGAELGLPMHCLGETRSQTSVDWSLAGRRYTAATTGFEHFD